jgi:hypothetical protein
MSRRKATWGGSGAHAATACLFLLLILVAGFWMLSDSPAPLPATTDDQSARNVVATIKFRPEGDLCRQATIDNKSGQMIEHGRLPCEKPSADSSGGGRLESIRNSFRSR